MDLFSYSEQKKGEGRSGPEPVSKGLAESLRPEGLDQLILADELSKRISNFQNVCRIQIQGRRTPPSLILFGPPGCGKTSTLRALASELSLDARPFLPTEDGAKELKSAVELARRNWLHGKPSQTLIIDEIHRLNRAAQDILLGAMEEGSLHILASTTENPSYALNPALISRTQVFEFRALSSVELARLLERAVLKWNHATLSSAFHPDASARLIEMSGGDARRLLNWVECAMNASEAQFPLSQDFVASVVGSTVAQFQSKGADHYDLISALIKSIRGSDPDAALYYLGRLVIAREQVEFIGRRLLILASEDIGNADPRALQVTMSAVQASQFVGWPEARIIFAQAVIYLSCAPKSNSAYVAIGKAIAEAERSMSVQVPHSLRSSRTHLSRSLGYGSGYQYSHDSERGYVPQRLLPEGVSGGFVSFRNYGFEGQLKKNLDWMQGTPSEASGGPDSKKADAQRG